MIPSTEAAEPTSVRRLVLGQRMELSEAVVHGWNDLPSGLDLSEFDEVVVSLGPGGSADDPVVLDADPLPLIDQLARLLLARGGSLTVIGNPESPVETPDGPVPFSFLLPLRLEVEEGTGADFRVLDERFSRYFESVGSWSFQFTGRCQVAEDALEASGVPTAPGRQISVEITPLAESHAGRSIGVTARFGLPDETGELPDGRASRLTVLPAPTELEVGGAIRRLFEAADPGTNGGGGADGRGEGAPVGGGDGEAAASVPAGPDGADEARAVASTFALADEEAPDWVDEVRLPAEASVREEMRGLEEQIERLERRLEEQRGELRKTGYLKRLLFTTGDTLVEVTLDALERLGARLEATGEEATADARIVDPEGRRAMVSVWSGDGSVGVEEVRDLDRRVRDAIALEGWDGRGVVIANSRAPLPPHERGAVYTDEAMAVARRFDVALVRSDQLFVAVRDAQRATLDQDGFWRALTGGDGLVDLPGLEAGPE